MHAAHEAVAAAAREAGADVAWGEIVGLVPQRAIENCAESHFRLRDSVKSHILEEQVRSSEGPSLAGFLDAVASSEPAPGGGTVAAIAGSMAAALAAMVGRLTIAARSTRMSTPNSAASTTRPRSCAAGCAASPTRTPRPTAT